MQWSRERLTALLTPLSATGLDAALGTATITQLKSLTGEVWRHAGHITASMHSSGVCAILCALR